MPRRYYVYILTNRRHTVLYTGVTGDIHRRITEHRKGRGSKFTRRYNVNKLVYLEEFNYIYDAIDREKQIKAGPRAAKIDLIDSINPEWRDLTEDLMLF